MIWSLFVFVACLALVAVGLFGTAEDDRGLVFVTASGGISDRGDVLDRAGRKVGYGTRRQDGAWDVYFLDGSRIGQVAPRVGMQLPAGKRALPGSRQGSARMTRRLV